MHSTDLRKRYHRALAQLGPKIAVRTPGLTVDGYWLDEDNYFFIAERLDPTLGLVSVPTLASVATNRVEEVMSLDCLSALLSRFEARSIGKAELTAATFEMSDLETLWVCLSRSVYRISVAKGCVDGCEKLPPNPEIYSPDGRLACFLNDHDLWLRDRRTGEERRLTRDGQQFRAYGRQSESCLITLSYRQQPYPVGLWSPDSQWLLTHRIDEQAVPETAVIQHSPPDHHRHILHTFKFPIPGDPWPLATFVAIHMPTGRCVSFDRHPTPVMAFSPFNFRTIWFGAEGVAWCTRIDRFSKVAELIRLDLVSGDSQIVVSESVEDGYIDLNAFIFMAPNVRILHRSNEIIWFSERDGWGHLYLYDATTGSLKNRITAGDWTVRDIAHVDEERRRLFFLAGGLDPDHDRARRSLCVVKLDGSGFERLLSHDGDVFVPINHSDGLLQDRPGRPPLATAGVSSGGRWAVATYSSVDKGNETAIFDLQSFGSLSLASAGPDHSDVIVRTFTARAADGVTQLYGTMFLPPDFEEIRRYPLIDDIYPGPQMAQQPQAFRSVWAAQARSLAELGFVTIQLDTRGTPVGSRAFHKCGYPDLLEPQLSDHVAVVKQLCERHSFLDSERIGMVGWSAGGFATARALCDHGDIFRVGVSACGNHDSSYYVALWSEKYRGPGDAETWSHQSNSAFAHKLSGKLLLISADTDENVHLSHTLRFVDALVRSNRDFDLLIVPNETHYIMITNGYAQRRTWDYFVRYLLMEEPPSNFEISYSDREKELCMRNYWRELQY